MKNEQVENEQETTIKFKTIYEWGESTREFSMEELLIPNKSLN